MKRFKIECVALGIVFFVTALATGAEAATSPHELVRALIANNELTEAERLVDGLEGDPAILSTYRGMISLRRGQSQEALAHFQRALQLAPARESLHLYIGQCLVGLERYAEARAALKKAAPVAGELLVFARLLARAQAGEGDRAAALKTLHAASQRYPNAVEVSLEQVRLYAAAGLSHAAHETALALMARTSLSTEQLRALASWCGAVTVGDSARVVLESIAAARPADPSVLSSVAHAYAAAAMPRAAGRLFGMASLAGADTEHAAADQYRVAGDWHRALGHNARVRLASERLPQRLAILIAAGDYTRAAAQTSAFESAGAWSDSTRYHMALAQYHLQDYPAARSHLAGIGAGPSKQNAEQLLRVIERVSPAD